MAKSTKRGTVSVSVSVTVTVSGFCSLRFFFFVFFGASLLGPSAFVDEV